MIFSYTSNQWFIGKSLQDIPSPARSLGVGFQRHMDRERRREVRSGELLQKE